MKRVTATEARRHWFRLLDEASAGEEIVVERNGKRLVLRCEEDRKGGIPDYAHLIHSKEDIDRADRWGWVWSDRGMKFVEDPPDRS